MYTILVIVCVILYHTSLLFCHPWQNQGQSGRWYRTSVYRYHSRPSCSAIPGKTRDRLACGITHPRTDTTVWQKAAGLLYNTLMDIRVNAAQGVQQAQPAEQTQPIDDKFRFILERHVDDEGLAER